MIISSMIFGSQYNTYMESKKRPINARVAFNKCLFCPGDCELRNTLATAGNITNRDKLDEFLRKNAQIDHVATNAGIAEHSTPYTDLNEASAEKTYFLLCPSDRLAIHGSVSYPINVDEVTEVIMSNRSKINSHTIFRRNAKK